MDGIWNRYNLKSTGRIYTFGVLKFSEKFKVLDLRSYICKLIIVKLNLIGKVTPSPARAHDSPPAWTSPQRLKVTHLRFPCQRPAPPLFKLSLILQ